MEFKRERYLQQLTDMRHTNFVKVITGLRRSGKTYLLFNLYKRYLLSDGVREDHIFEMSFDDPDNFKYRDCDVFYAHVKEFVGKTEGMHYIFLDEVQLLDKFEYVLCGLLRMPGVDIYVTGSNSKFLSKDVITEFRGRGWEIHVWPLSFSEFMEEYPGDVNAGWDEYCTYGGMPEAVNLRGDEKKMDYLKRLFSNVYFNDVVNRYGLDRESEMDEILNALASSIGSLTNPDRMAKIFKSVENVTINPKSIAKYTDWLCDAFLLEKSMRFDVKGNKYINTPYKYYFTDIGLRNARINFRQHEEPHILENIIYDELRMRGYGVDVGVVTLNGKENGKSVRNQLEADFVCNSGHERIYIQSAYYIPDDEKMAEVKRPLLKIGDEFKKVIVTYGNFKPWHTDEGILMLSVYDFLLDRDSLAL